MIFVHFASKQEKKTILEAFTLVSQSLSQILGKNITSVFLRYLGPNLEYLVRDKVLLANS